VLVFAAWTKICRLCIFHANDFEFEVWLKSPVAGIFGDSISQEKEVTRKEDTNDDYCVLRE